MTAPMLSSSRLSARPVIFSPVSEARELEHLAGHRLLQAVDAGDAVLHLEDGADLLDVDRAEIGGLDLLEEDVLQFAGAEDRVSGHRSQP